MAADSALALWQTLGGLLHRRGPERIVPRRLAVEALATAQGTRVGVWVPPSLPAAAVAAALRVTWPAAVLTPAGTAPVWPAAGVSAVELRPRGGPWAPLTDTTPRAPRAGEGGEAEPLRAVFAALADRGAGELAAVQIVIRAHRGAGAQPWAARAAGALLRMGAGLVLELATILLPGRHAPTRTTTRTPGRAVTSDPVAAAALKASDAKRVAGPHLRVTLRVALATNPNMALAGRRHRLARITGGFDLVTTPLRTGRVRRPASALTGRLPGRSFLATLPELAAVWHIPAEPGRYALAAQPARNRPPERHLPHLPGGPTQLLDTTPNTDTATTGDAEVGHGAGHAS